MRRVFLGCVSVGALLLAGEAVAQTTSGAPSGAGSDPVASPSTNAPISGQSGPGKAPSENPSESSANANVSAGPASSTPDSGRLGDIIVTANRREESQQRAAVSVNVVRGADLIAAGTTEPYRLSELAPGLQIQPSGSYNAIFIRGVGNLTGTPNADPATAFNYDGVYVGRPTSTNGLFFDLDRIEVLKGPQGTLYGRNATGGAINVIPTQPKLGEFSGYVTGSYGSYNTGTVEGAINAPLGDDGAIRASGSYTHHDGYLSDGTSDKDLLSVRLQMKAKLTPDLTVRVSGDYERLTGASQGFTYRGYFTQTATANTFIPSNLPLSDGIFSPASQAFRTSLVAGTAKRPYDPVGPFPNRSDNFYGANAQVDWNVGFGTLTIIPAWRYSRLDEQNQVGFFGRTREKDEQYSAEARLTGNRVGAFDYILGGYYYDEDVVSIQSINIQSAASFPGPNRYHTKSFAPFGRVTAHLSDRLRIVGGVRYSKDIKTFVGTTTAFQIICVAASCPTTPLLPTVDAFSQYTFPIPAGAGTLPYAAGSVIFRGATRNDNSRLVSDRVTYHGGIEFDVAPRSLLYGTVETGYRAGGFSPATGFETYQPEYITAWTVGSKNRFFGDRVQLNVEGFLWNYRNQQISHVGVDLSGRAANFTQNVGRSRIKGVEVEAKVLATPTTLLSADVQYLDARYLSFTYPQLYTGSNPLNTCANTVSGTLITVDCSGKPPIESPKWTINLGVQQTIPLGQYKFVAGADSQHQSSRYLSFEYLPQELVGSTWTANAQLLFGPSNDRWSIAGFVRNIGNKRIPVSANFVPTTSIYVETTIAPRVYGVRGSFKF